MHAISSEILSLFASARVSSATLAIPSGEARERAREVWSGWNGTARRLHRRAGDIATTEALESLLLDRDLLAHGTANTDHQMTPMDVVGLDLWSAAIRSRAVGFIIHSAAAQHSSVLARRGWVIEIDLDRRVMWAWWTASGTPEHGLKLALTTTAEEPIYA